MTTEEETRFARLPKWAREELTHCKNQNKRLEGQIHRLEERAARAEIRLEEAYEQLRKTGQMDWVIEAHNR